MAKEPKMKIGIGADTGDFEKGSKKVKDALKQLGIDANSAAGKMVASLGKATVALAGVVTAIKVVGKALNDLKDQNQVLADSWGRACEGMAGAFETFKSAIVSLDFSNLLSNMAEAARLAQDLYDAADAMGEITTAYNISLAQQLKTIDELRLKMKDTSLSEQERVKAGNDLLEIYRQLEKNPTRGLNRVSETTIDYYMQKMGVNMNDRTDAQLEQMRKKYLDFFKWLGTKQGENFLSAAETVAKSGGLDSYWGKTVLANAKNSGLEEYFRLAYSYSTKMGDKDREKLEQAVVAALQQEYKYSQETFKIRKDIQTIQNESEAAAAKAAEATAKAAKEEADNIARIKALRESGGGIQAIGGGVDLSAYNRVEVPVKPIVRPEEVHEFKAHIVEELGGGITIAIAIDPDSVEKIHDITNEINSMVENMAVSVGDALGQLAGNLINGEDPWGQFANAALSAMGDMAVSVGKMAISTGVATLGIKAALESLNGYVAIAAGVALVALGAAVKTGLSNIASGNYSSGAGVVTSNASSSFNNAYEQRDVYVNVTGTLRADGNQLVAVLNNTNKRNNITT